MAMRVTTDETNVEQQDSGELVESAERVSRIPNMEGRIIGASGDGVFVQLEQHCGAELLQTVARITNSGHITLSRTHTAGESVTFALTREAFEYLRAAYDNAVALAATEHQEYIERLRSSRWMN